MLNNEGRGITWFNGRMTTRIPGIHTKFRLNDLIQGAFLVTACGAGASHLMVQHFQVPFELVWTAVIFQLAMYVFSVHIAGCPYTPGWISASIPLTLVYLSGYSPGTEAIQATIALMLLTGAICIFFGITGLGAKLFSWLPPEIRAAIIMGAAIGAFRGEIARIETMPITLTLVWIVFFVLVYSVALQKIKTKNAFLTTLASLAMFISIVISAVVGPLANEINFNIQWGVFVPPLGEYLNHFNPFFIGWPRWDMFLNAFPLALASYIIAFGDLLVANDLIRDANKRRTDEDVVGKIDNSRTFVMVGLRNLIHAFTGGAWIPLQGPVFMGGHVFALRNWQEKYNPGSFFSSTTTWYFAPLIYAFFLPFVTFLNPILPVALSVTMLVTGFACSHLALSLATTPTSRGYVLLSGLFIFVLGPAYGVLLALGLYMILLFEKRTTTVETDLETTV